MLDNHTLAIIQTFIRQTAGLYRARPYTKAIPFRVTVNTAGVFPLWTPQNAYFEFNRMYILGSVANIDYLLVDTNATSVMGMVVPSTSAYTLVDYGGVGYRSLLASNSIMGIVDPLASGATVKGVILGWEVTPEGNYR